MISSYLRRERASSTALNGFALPTCPSTRRDAQAEESTAYRRNWFKSSDGSTSPTTSSPPPTTLSPRPPNSTPAMSRQQPDPVTKRTAGVPPRPIRSPARTTLPRGDHADELHRASPVRLIDVTDQTVVTWNQAAAVAAGLRWHCPAGFSHEVADANSRTPQYRREPRPGPARRESHPSPHRRLNRAANDRRRPMPERLLTVPEAGEMLNTGERFRVG